MNYKDGWWDSFFNNNYIHVWSTFQSKFGISGDKEVEGIKKILRVSKREKILDIGCGFGRHLIPFSLEGFDIIGLDISNYMFQAMDLERTMPVKPKLVLADMRRIPFACFFDCAIMISGTFGYLRNNWEHILLLNEISKVIKKNALLLIDCVNKEPRLNNIQPVWGFQLDESREVIIVSRYDEINKYYLEILEIRGNETEWSQQYCVRLFELKEIIDLLNISSFLVEGTYGDLIKSSYNPNSSPRMVILARKK